MRSQNTPKIVSQFVTLVIFLCGFSTFAQNRTLKWDDELCQYQGTYNAKKFTPTQLRNTLKLFDHGSFSLATTATVFDPQDIAKLDVGKLDDEYKAMAAALASLDIVKSPYWQAERLRKLAEIKQVYELSRVSMLGYTNPRSLNDLAGSDSCKTKYAVPLIAGGDSLLRIWRTVSDVQRAKNGDPGRLKSIFEQQLASGDKFKYALVEVMTFGWWNCANDSIKYVKYDGSQERDFKKLFVRVKKIRCDEP